MILVLISIFFLLFWFFLYQILKSGLLKSYHFKIFLHHQFRLWWYKVFSWMVKIGICWRVSMVTRLCTNSNPRPIYRSPRTESRAQSHDFWKSNLYINNENSLRHFTTLASIRHVTSPTPITWPKSVTWPKSLISPKNVNSQKKIDQSKNLENFDST